jgi:hypothetical protein
LNNRLPIKFFLIILFLGWTILPSPGFGADKGVLKADGKTNFMPVHWDQAFLRLISSPDKGKLERGEILCEIKKRDSNTVIAQSIGIIKAKAEDCFKVVRSYNQYTKLMPSTVENKVIRSFLLEGDQAGVEAVDFWTRVRVLGFSTRYLLRIVHLLEPVKQQFRSFWTLVDNPDQLPACLDKEGKSCRNDLSVNLGSHQFEPFPGNTNYTLHTYTVTVSGKSWWQQTAFRLGGTKSMEAVTQAIRNVLEK